MCGTHPTKNMLDNRGVQGDGSYVGCMPLVHAPRLLIGATKIY